MTALVLKNLAALPVQAQSLRMFLARLARALDALVSARAARAVTECELRRAEREINRYHRRMRRSTARRVGAKSAAASSHHAAQSMQMR